MIGNNFFLSTEQLPASVHHNWALVIFVKFDFLQLLCWIWILLDDGHNVVASQWMTETWTVFMLHLHPVESQKQFESAQWKTS